MRRSRSRSTSTSCGSRRPAASAPTSGSSGPQLERSDQVELTPFRSRWKHEAAGVPATAVPIVIPARRPGRSTRLVGRATAEAAARARRVPGGARHEPRGVPPIRDGQALVVTVHDLAFEDDPDAFPATWRWLYRRGLERAEGSRDVLVPREYVGGRLRERGIAADRLRVTPLARHAPACARTDAASRGRRAGSASTVPTWCRSERSSRARTRCGWSARIAGRSPMPTSPTRWCWRAPGWRTDELDAELAEDGPGRIVRLEGLGDLELDALYRAADAVAYASLYEGFGLPVLEAMAAVRPWWRLDDVDPRGGRRRRPAGGSHRRRRDREGARDGPDRCDGGGRPARRGYDRAGRFSWEATARATLDAYRQAVEAR